MIDRQLPPAELTRLGIAAAKAGRKAEGRDYLLASVEADERQETAWLWLGGLVDDVQDQIVALENALEINPGNEAARRKLDQLRAQVGVSNPLPTTPQPATYNSSQPAPSPFATQPAPLPPAMQPAPFGSTQPAPSPFGAQPQPSPFGAQPPPSFGSSTQPAPSPFGPQPLSSPFNLSPLPVSHQANDDDQAMTNSLNPTPGTDGAANQPSQIGRPLMRGSTSSSLFHRPFDDQPQSTRDMSGSGEQPATFGEAGYSTQAFAGSDYSTPAYTRDMTASDALNYSPFEQPTATATSSGYGYDNRELSLFNNDEQLSDEAQHQHWEEVAKEANAEPDVLECPYCGWVTRLEDNYCSNCKGNLYLEYRNREGRSGSLIILFVLWLISAVVSALVFAGSLLLIDALNNRSIMEQLPPGFDMSAATAIKSVFNVLALIFFVQMALAVVSAIGTIARVRIFYYLNMGAVALSFITSVITFFLTGANDVITLIISTVINMAIFGLVMNSEDDFIPQRRRIGMPQEQGSRTANDSFNLGVKLQKAGYTALAARAWRRAVSGAPGNSGFRLSLAGAYMQMKRFDLAEQEAREAIRFEPGNLKAINLLALIFSRGGRYTEAQQQLEAALQLKPGDELTLETQRTIEREQQRATKIGNRQVKALKASPLKGEVGGGIMDERAERVSSTTRNRDSTVSPNELDLISHSVEQTRRVGQRLAELLQPGDVLLLEGQLGAGKTAFTQGIAAGLGINDYVNSPTFVLINEYPGRLPLYHIDLYRFDDPRQAIAIGLEDYLPEPEGVTVVEWPERAMDFMPPEHLLVRIGYLSDTKRTIRFRAEGDDYLELLNAFKQGNFG